MTDSHLVGRVQGLTVYRGVYPALQEVSFDLWQGTHTAIVGPNGSGKSTLVLTLLGLLPYQKGRVELFHQEVSRLGQLRARIGYVPQDFIFERSFPISVEELVSLGWFPTDATGTLAKRASPFSWRWPWQPNMHQKAAVNHALQRVGVGRLRHQPIGTLSTGQLKRVLLAYCLVVPRRLLVLDEVFAGIDAQGASEFYDLLNELKQEQGWTIVQVSHDIDMVNRHCDRVLCLNQRLICDGRPEEALAIENLIAAYGPGLTRYHHHH